jgi:cytochrome c biogenesis protein CcmG/thiol:disulfide interchange protein DsbE
MNSREFAQIAVACATPSALHLLRLLLTLSFIAISPVITAQSVPSTLLHHAAPRFSRQDISSNKTIQLDAFRGKVVLLSFWATWCAPCLTEMPAFREWQKQYGSRTFQVIGVSMDDEATNVVATIDRLKLFYPVLMGDEELGVAYGGVLGLPVTFLIDRHGRVQARYENADLASMKRDLQRLLDSR